MTHHALAIAISPENLISYDSNHRPALWSDEVLAKAGLLLNLSKAHIIKNSEDEVELSIGPRDLNTVSRSLHALRGPLERL